MIFFNIYWSQRVVNKQIIHVECHRYTNSTQKYMQKNAN